MTVLKDFVAPFRQQFKVQAVQRFETEPGEQMQADWGNLGTFELDVVCTRSGFLCLFWVIHVFWQLIAQPQRLRGALLQSMRLLRGCAAMNLASVRAKLEGLGLAQASLILDSRAEQAVKSDWSYVEFVDRLLAEEVAARRGRSLKTRTRLVRIKDKKTLEDFDFDAQPGVDRKLVSELATLTFIDRTDNVCFLGPPGVEKSHLGYCLGRKGLGRGIHDLFYNLRQADDRS